MKYVLLFIVFFIAFVLQAQRDTLRNKHKTFAIQDSLTYHEVSTNPYFFKIFDKDSIEIDTSYYRVDFSKSKLIFNADFTNKFTALDSIQVHYFTYPEFLTKVYKGLDESIIVSNSSKEKPTVLFKEKEVINKPFSGLDTQGSIIRGIRIGNNQDAVLNSVLDLQIEGKLSSKVSLKARINDTNIPIQESGYSQDLKDLDRVYIEMDGGNWGIRAGDVFLQNNKTHFMNFNKKVAGVGVRAKIDSTLYFTSGAIVKGRYTTQNFQGQEANQGPYKLKGKKGEAYVFIISGSEKVYVNGMLQTRGKDQDYVIDYNTAEVVFMPTKPITSDMRIRVEFQYSDRNYTRFMTNNGVQYKNNKFEIGAYFYRESDVKSQPLQLNLTEDQIELLANSNGSNEQLFVTNAVETTYDENKILYRKISDGIYEYSADATETLYQVSFTYFGKNQGDYKVDEYLATGKKMLYVGENMGEYKALIPLIAPSRQQVVVLNSHYKPNHKTDLELELAYSDNNNNLFSTATSQNSAPALKAAFHQVLLDSTTRKWQLESKIDYNFLHSNFKSIERVFEVEFDRNWNLEEKTGNQSLLSTSVTLSKREKVQVYYTFDNLNFTNNYNGNRHGIGGNFDFEKLKIQHQSSYLKSTGITKKTTFARSQTSARYSEKKWWVGSVFDIEQNVKKDQNNTLSPLSYQFLDLQESVGIGDSTQVFVELGTRFHVNDSLVGTKLELVNKSNSFFINSQLIKTKSAELKLYSNYRKVDNTRIANTEALNSKLIYRQQLFNQILSFQTNFQNTSGNIVQHEYTYVETEPGHGYYTWNDYNGNGLQELDEFEVAQYADQANFLRISLPNLHYIPTQEAQLQQRIQINFSRWAAEKRFKKTLSHWYNEFNVLAKNNIKRVNGLLNLNPFDMDNPDAIAQQLNLRNSLVFNRGKSHYTTSYNYSKTRQKSIQSFGTQQNNIEIHQLNFQHKIQEDWLFGVLGKHTDNSSANSNFTNRNYQLQEQEIAPNISYFFNRKHWIKSEYAYTTKENKIGALEALAQQQIGLSYNFTNDKQTSFSAELKMLNNIFDGNSNSTVGYQMLEGLQPDNNMTWNLIWSKKINSFLFLNLNYNGRANEISRSIHNANVQLRASF